MYDVYMGALFGDVHDHIWLSHFTTSSTTVDISSSLHPVTNDILSSVLQALFHINVSLP